jgi:hypothetical protein
MTETKATTNHIQPLAGDMDAHDVKASSRQHPECSPPADEQPRSRVRWQTVVVTLCLMTLFVIAAASSSLVWSRIKIGPHNHTFYFKEYRENDGEKRMYPDEIEETYSYNKKRGAWGACEEMMKAFRTAGERTIAAYWTVWAGIITCGVLFTIHLDHNGEKRAVKVINTILFFVCSLLFIFPLKSWTLAVPSTSSVSDCYCSLGCPMGTFSTLEAGGISCYVGALVCLVAAIANHNDYTNSIHLHSPDDNCENV